jgi:hypothetical protein
VIAVGLVVVGKLAFGLYHFVIEPMLSTVADLWREKKRQKIEKKLTKGNE